MPGLFYIDALPEPGELAVVEGGAGFHAATVRRLRPGQQLVLGDGVGGLARCVVDQAGRGVLQARVFDRWQVPPGRRPVNPPASASRLTLARLFRGFFALTSI